VDEEASVVRLDPASSSLSTAAYAVLAAVGAEGLSRMKVVSGKLLAVFGLGMLGLLSGRIAQLQGLIVVGVNRSAWKRGLALDFGFDAVCEPTAPALRRTLEAMGSKEVNLAFDTTGNGDVLDLAVACLSNDGQLSLGGYYPDKILFNFDLCHGKNLVIHNPVGHGAQVPHVVRLIEEGKINAESLVCHRIRPSEITNFYADLVSNHSRYLGVVIDWKS
jgi:2-desacetyl-2-hydroxyethyl bacteriochlorophyllide A dehydrogenase